MKKILLLAGLISISIGTAGDTLPSELLTKYYNSTNVIVGGNVTLNKVIINGPSTPPPGIVRKTVSAVDAVKTAASNSISEIPAYEWSFGCASTSGAMIAGYYDRIGYVDVYTGPTNNGVMPLDNSIWGTWTDSIGDINAQCPLSASRNGVDGRTDKGHVDDYWIGYGSTAVDPYITGSWTQHQDRDCTGDFMKTNQSAYGNSDGETVFYFNRNSTPLTDTDMENAGVDNDDGAYGLKLFFEERGYAVTTLYNQNIDADYVGGFSFAQYKSEIDAGHPILIHVTGHTMVGVGYDDTTSTVYLHDTWDYATHSMVWGGKYSGMDHFGVTVIHLVSLSNQIPTADAGPDRTTVVNQTITITGSGSDPDGTITAYQWKEGNTVLASTASFNYTPTTVGDHTLTLTVTDDDGAVNSDTMIVTATESTTSSGGGGGCSYNPHNQTFDAMVLIMLLVSLAYPIRRKLIK